MSQHNVIESLQELYTDKKFRAHAINDPKGFAQKNRMIDKNSNINVKTCINTKDTLYIVIPNAVSDKVSQSDMKNITAAGYGASSTGTIGTAGSFFTFGSAPTSVSSASTIGSVGTASSAGSAT